MLSKLGIILCSHDDARRYTTFGIYMLVSNGGAWLSEQPISFLFVWPVAWHFNKLHNTDDFFIALRGHSVQQTSGEVVRPMMKTQE